MYMMSETINTIWLNDRYFVGKQMMERAPRYTLTYAHNQPEEQKNYTGICGG